MMNWFVVSKIKTSKLISVRDMDQASKIQLDRVVVQNSMKSCSGKFLSLSSYLLKIWL